MGYETIDKVGQILGVV